VTGTRAGRKIHHFGQPRWPPSGGADSGGMNVAAVQYRRSIISSGTSTARSSIRRRRLLQSVTSRVLIEGARRFISEYARCCGLQNWHAAFYLWPSWHAAEETRFRHHHRREPISACLPLRFLPPRCWATRPPRLLSPLCQSMASTTRLTSPSKVCRKELMPHRRLSP
jgi:hypothetical protein